MNKIFSTIAVATALLAGYSTYNAQNDAKLSDIALNNVEALANGSDVALDCGNVTFIPNKTLKSSLCMLGFTGTHLVCKPEDKVCCDPSKQTDCKPLVSVDI
jgi:hypothetical protein